MPSELWSAGIIANQLVTGWLLNKNADSSGQIMLIAIVSVATAGSYIYIAPEVLRQNYSLPSDLWSAGIIAYQLITGWLPFAGEEGEDVSTRYMETTQFDRKVQRPGLDPVYVSL